jgi:chromosome segregation ATPase
VTANRHLDAQAGNLDQYIRALDAKISELRELIREANGTLKDARRERRLTEAQIGQFGDQLDARLCAEVEKGLTRFHGEISQAVEGATRAVYDRFDLIAALCLGEDATSQAEGKTPLDELVRRYIAKNGPVI